MSLPKNTFILLSFFLLGMCPHLYPQEVPTLRERIWLDFSHSRPLNDRLKYTGTASVRWIFADHLDYRWVYRPGFSWKWKARWTVYGNVGMFYTTVHHRQDQIELRPIQCLKYELLSTPHLKFSLGTGLEERFRLQPSPDPLRVLWFWRNCASLKLSLNESGSLYIPMYYELFTRLVGEDHHLNMFQQRMHAYVGLGTRLKSGWGVEFTAWAWQSTANSEDPMRLSDVVFRLKFTKK